MSWRWARQHRNGGGSSSVLLLLLPLLLWHGRVRPAGADNASQAYYTALINVTVLSPERGGPTLLRIDRGRYGQDSPKVEVKGLLVAPVPINGGNAPPSPGFPPSVPGARMALPSGGSAVGCLPPPPQGAWPLSELCGLSQRALTNEEEEELAQRKIFRNFKKKKKKVHESAGLNNSSAKRRAFSSMDPSRVER